MSKEANPLRIGIVGLGTVGAGVFKIFSEKNALLSDRADRPISITAVSARNKNKDRGINLNNVQWYNNPEHLVSDPEIDLVVELVGGADGVAYEICKNALKNKKSVVTANKALIAKHGIELAGIAEKNNVALCFEASVAGGIPIIKTVKESLTANKIKSIAGILNGTCNYILTSMKDNNKDFSTALKEAQDLGYAEADPTFDVDGIDTAHKLSILAALAFGCPVNFDGVYIEGIKNITIKDVEYASELGYVIKLLGICEISNDESSYEQRVHPCLVQKLSSIAEVYGVLNGITINSDTLGNLFLQGAGAGQNPTASAVVADIIDVASGRLSKPFGVPVKKLRKIKSGKITEYSGKYYLRLNVADKPGVVASITSVLKDTEISIESLLQKAHKPDSTAQIVFTTHHSTEEAIVKAIKSISKIENVLEKPNMIRIFEN